MARYVEGILFRIKDERVYLELETKDHGGTLTVSLNSPHTGASMGGWWAGTRHHITAVEEAVSICKAIEDDKQYQIPVSVLGPPLGSGFWIREALEKHIQAQGYTLWDGTTEEECGRCNPPEWDKEI